MKVIVTSDWHIQTRTPVARKETDWWEEAIKPKIKEILSLDLPVWFGGDMFDAPGFNSLRVLNWLRRKLKDFDIVGIPGNHDLYEYSKSTFERTAFYNVMGYRLPSNYIVTGSDFESGPVESEVLFYHGFVSREKPPFYMDQAIRAETLAWTFPNVRIFVVGDNHKGFVWTNNKQVVINPGAINRRTVNHKDYRPRVYILDTETLAVKPYYFKCEKDVWRKEDDIVNVDFSEIKKKLTEKIEALDFEAIVNSLAGELEQDLQERIKQYLQEASYGRN